MRTRSNRIVFYLNDEELENLTQKIDRTGYSREAFIRRALEGVTIKEGPHADVPLLLVEISRVGYNINQILKIAQSNGILNIPDLRKAADDLYKVRKLILSHYISE